jgi:signal transduction histidine kinase
VIQGEPDPVQLAIAQTIAEAHGGRLSLANRAEGGLRASITLPA